MKSLLSGMLVWSLVTFSHLVYSYSCDKVIIKINGRTMLRIEPSLSGIIMRRVQEGEDDYEESSSTATFSNRLSDNPGTAFTMGGMDNCSIGSLNNFIAAMGSRTVRITGQDDVVQYRVVDSSDRSGRYDRVWSELGRVNMNHWHQLFTDSDFFLRGGGHSTQYPEQFFQNAHSVVRSDHSSDYTVNPLCLFFNRQWLQQFTQFLQMGTTPSTGYYHLDLRVLYFRPDWTVHLREPELSYRVFLQGRTLLLDIENTVGQALRRVNPGYGNELLPFAEVIRETTL